MALLAAESRWLPPRRVAANIGVHEVPASHLQNPIPMAGCIHGCLMDIVSTSCGGFSPWSFNKETSRSINLPCMIMDGQVLNMKSRKAPLTRWLGQISTTWTGSLAWGRSMCLRATASDVKGGDLRVALGPEPVRVEASMASGGYRKGRGHQAALVIQEVGCEMSCHEHRTSMIVTHSLELPTAYPEDADVRPSSRLRSPPP